MSLKEIEAELEKLAPDELCRLALRSWTAFVQKERGVQGFNECSEDDPNLLAALDEAVARAESAPERGYSGHEVRAWTDHGTGLEIGHSGANSCYDVEASLYFVSSCYASRMPTALQLSRDGWQSFVNAARRRGPSSPPSSDEADKRAELLNRIRRAARVLRESFPVGRIILFGSLAHGGWFSPDSDVDLAVEGLAPAHYWKAWRLLEDILADRSVDLIDLDTAGASLRQAIARQGISL